METCIECGDAMPSQAMRHELAGPICAVCDRVPCYHCSRLADGPVEWDGGVPYHADCYRTAIRLGSVAVSSGSVGTVPTSAVEPAR